MTFASAFSATNDDSNQIRDWMRYTIPAVSFSGEQVVFTQSHMDESNFPDDLEGNTCLLGFENVGLLPESFAKFTMSDGPFAKKVAEYLDWPDSRSLSSMGRIRGTLWMLSDETAGTSAYT